MLLTPVGKDQVSGTLLNAVQYAGQPPHPNGSKVEIFRDELSREAWALAPRGGVCQLEWLAREETSQGGLER